MASGDVWRVQMDMLWGSVVCRPGFNLVEGAGGGDPDIGKNVADAVEAALSGLGLTGFSDQLTWSACIIMNVQPGTIPTKRYPLIAPAVGTVVDANPLPPQSAGVISIRTALKPVVGAYAAMGRIYMPGIPQNGQISGFLQAGFQSTLDDFAAALFDAFVSDGTAYQWNVVSLTPGSQPVTVRAIQPVVDYTINNVVRSQRRRQFGVGQ